MDFLINNAWAQAAAGTPQQQGIAAFLPLAVLFVVFYFILIRPQMKRQKEHSKLVNELAKGDEVATNGGIVGKVTEVGTNFIRLEIAKDIEIKVQKQAVSQVMPKGSLKEL